MTCIIQPLTSLCRSCVVVATLRCRSQSTEDSDAALSEGPTSSGGGGGGVLGSASGGGNLGGGISSSRRKRRMPEGGGSPMDVCVVTPFTGKRRCCAVKTSCPPLALFHFDLTVVPLLFSCCRGGPGASGTRAAAAAATAHQRAMSFIFPGIVRCGGRVGALGCRGGLAGGSAAPPVGRQLRCVFCVCVGGGECKSKRCSSKRAQQ